MTAHEEYGQQFAPQVAGLGGQAVIRFTETSESPSPFPYLTPLTTIVRPDTAFILTVPNQGNVHIGSAVYHVFWDEENDLTFRPDPNDTTTLINGLNADLVLTGTGLLGSKLVLVANTGETWRVHYVNEPVPP